MNKVMVIGVRLLVLFFIDWYFYQAVGVWVKGSTQNIIKWLKWAYWGITIATFLLILFYNFGNPDWFEGQTRSLVLTAVFINYFST